MNLNHKSDDFDIWQEPEIDDRPSCRKCGIKISDASFDDNDGLCNTCSK